MIILLKVLCEDIVILSGLGESSVDFCIVMAYASISYQLSFLVIQQFVLFSFHIIEYWSSVKMCNEGFAILWF